MKSETKNKGSLNLVEALITATGIVAMGSVVASGAALGALVEGFKAAGKVVKDSLAEQKAEAEKNREETVAAQETKEDSEQTAADQNTEAEKSETVVDQKTEAVIEPENTVKTVGNIDEN